MLYAHNTTYRGRHDTQDIFHFLEMTLPLAECHYAECRYAECRGALTSLFDSSHQSYIIKIVEKKRVNICNKVLLPKK